MGTLIETYRILLLSIAFFILATLSIFSLYVGMTNDQSATDQIYNCLTLREPCSGEIITLVAQVHVIEDGTVTVLLRTRRGGRSDKSFDQNYPVEIIHGALPLSIGEVAALQGQLLTNNQFQLHGYQTEKHWVREVKYGISILGLLAAMVTWFSAFRFSFRTFRFLEKRIESNA